MPWCEPCAKFYNPNSLADEGECPACGEALEVTEATKLANEDVKVPWHFWLMLTAIVVYLGWRVIQGVDALFGWL